MVSHCLQIELGRQNKNVVPKEERLCSCGDIEDEKHFISSCHHYSHIYVKYEELRNLPFHIKLDSEATPDFIHDLVNYRSTKGRQY